MPRQNIRLKGFDYRKHQDVELDLEEWLRLIHEAVRIKEEDDDSLLLFERIDRGDRVGDQRIRREVYGYSAYRRKLLKGVRVRHRASAAHRTARTGALVE